MSKATPPSSAGKLSTIAKATASNKRKLSLGSSAEKSNENLIKNKKTKTNEANKTEAVKNSTPIKAAAQNKKNNETVAEKKITSPVNSKASSKKATITGEPKQSTPSTTSASNKKSKANNETAASSKKTTFTGEPKQSPTSTTSASNKKSKANNEVAATTSKVNSPRTESISTDNDDDKDTTNSITSSRSSLRSKTKALESIAVNKTINKSKPLTTKELRSKVPIDHLPISSPHRTRKSITLPANANDSIGKRKLSPNNSPNTKIVGRSKRIKTGMKEPENLKRVNANRNLRGKTSSSSSIGKFN